MSELALTLLRLGFLALLWFFVITAIGTLRRDLAAPGDAAIAPVNNGSPSNGTSRKRRPRANNLAVVEGALAGTVIPLGSSPITIGRAPDSTLVVTDDFASGRHARLYPHEGKWVVEDLGSTNGTRIDATLITGPTLLNPGQKLRVGRTVLELRK